jgi:hypothetical protein
MFIFYLKIERHLSFTEFVNWILPLCLNILDLKLRNTFGQPNDWHKDIIHLKKLKVLDIETSNEIDPKEVTCVAIRSKATLLTFS